MTKKIRDILKNIMLSIKKLLTHSDYLIINKSWETYWEDSVNIALNDTSR